MVERVVCPQCRVAYSLPKEQVTENEGIICPCGWKGDYWIDLGGEFDGFLVTRSSLDG